MIIAAEGMDGVGKTEAAKYFSNKYGFTFIEKLLHYFYKDGPEQKYKDLMEIANWYQIFIGMEITRVKQFLKF